MTIEVSLTQTKVAGNGAGAPSSTADGAASGTQAPGGLADGRGLGGTRRRSYARIPTVLEAPNLVQIQLDSFRWFTNEGLQELLDEISPIQDYNQKSMDLSFPAFRFEKPRGPKETDDLSEEEVIALCRERDLTYSAPLPARRHAAG